MSRVSGRLATLSRRAPASSVPIVCASITVTLANDAEQQHGRLSPPKCLSVARYGGRPVSLS